MNSLIINEAAGMDENQYSQAQNLLSEDQRRLFEFVSRQVQREITGIECPPIRLFISASAGTGKSHILKLIVEHIRRSYRKLHFPETHCYVRVCAFTGVAALSIGGETLHSALIFIPSYKENTGDLLEDSEMLQQLWRHTRFIIIDQISMVSYEKLHKIHCLLQDLKCNDIDLFGGVNVLLFGDLMQLPPACGTPVFIQPKYMNDDVHLFQQFSFCELKETVCPKGDSTYIELLNNLRVGKLTTEQYKLLKSKVNNSKQQGDFAPGQALRIVPTNRMVDTHNEHVIRNLNPAIEKFEIVAQDRLVKQKKSEIQVPLEEVIPTNINDTAGIPHTLTLYKGLRVMLRYNVDAARGLVNGTIGMIVDIHFPEWLQQKRYKYDIPTVVMKIDNSEKEETIEPITVTFDAFCGYGKVERRMLPFIPCYALTVHKLQGCTVSKAVINLGGNYFAPGQKFVALSCCKSLDDIEIDEISPEGLIDGDVCNKIGLNEMSRLQNLKPYDEED